MAQITRSTKINGGTTLAANTLARAIDLETDILGLFNAHNNHDTGTSKWTTVSALGASAVPLVSDNSTGTQDILDLKDNGTTVVSVADGGTVTVAPGGTTKVVANASGITLSNSATLAMGSAKITGLAAGTATGDAVHFGQFPGLKGTVKQVVASSVLTSADTVTSQTFVGTNLNVTITPSSASSKIIVFAVGNVRTTNIAVANPVATIFRNPSTNLAVSGGGSIDGFSIIVGPSLTGALSYNANMIYVDAPATTSAVTYSVQMRCDGTLTAVTWGAYGPTYMYAIEVVQ